jgi:hypothetical protein
MSWGVNRIGRAVPLAAKVAEDLNRIKCIDPEESIKQAAGALIAAALAAQGPGIVVKLEAAGHQSGSGSELSNTLTISLQPVYGFVE